MYLQRVRQGVYITWRGWDQEDKYEEDESRKINLHTSCQGYMPGVGVSTGIFTWRGCASRHQYLSKKVCGRGRCFVSIPAREAGVSRGRVGRASVAEKNTTTHCNRRGRGPAAVAAVIQLPPPPGRAGFRRNRSHLIRSKYKESTIYFLYGSNY